MFVTHDRSLWRPPEGSFLAFLEVSTVSTPNEVKGTSGTDSFLEKIPLSVVGQKRAARGRTSHPPRNPVHPRSNGTLL